MEETTCRVPKERDFPQFAGFSALSLKVQHLGEETE